MVVVKPVVVRAAASAVASAAVAGATIGLQPTLRAALLQVIPVGCACLPPVPLAPAPRRARSLGPALAFAPALLVLAPTLAPLPLLLSISILRGYRSLNQALPHESLPPSQPVVAATTRGTKMVSSPEVMACPAV